MRRRWRDNRNLAVGGGQCWRWCRRLSSLSSWTCGSSISRSRHCSATSPRRRCSDVSWILAVYAIVLAALLLPAGRAADSIGRRECFLAGLGDLRRRIAGMRGGPGPAGADRLPGAAGRRGRSADAHLTRACAIGVPATSAGHRGRGMGRGRSGRRWQRPGDGRAADRVELALDLPYQPARRPRRLGGGRGDIAAARR